MLLSYTAKKYLFPILSYIKIMNLVMPRLPAPAIRLAVLQTFQCIYLFFFTPCFDRRKDWVLQIILYSNRFAIDDF